MNVYKGFNLEKLKNKIDIENFHIPSQTNKEDKTSLEALRFFIEIECDNYIYLETGSYLGGTLMPYLLSSKCSSVISVDKRVDYQADERRNEGYNYDGISVETMLDKVLPKLKPEQALKLITITGDLSEINIESFKNRFSELCKIIFIDAEHTNEAVFSDFLSALKLINQDGLIVFHDSWIISSGLKNILSYLEYQHKKYYFIPMLGSVSALFLGKYAESDFIPTVLKYKQKEQSEIFKEYENKLWDFRKKEILT